MDERLVKILESRSTTPQTKAMILDALTGDFTDESLASAYGTSARSVKRQFRALSGGKSATNLKMANG
jgi:AraC-like DNA-binding protein